MFELRNELDKELRELRDNEKGTRDQADGLNLETERVRQTVDYADQSFGCR
jgi:hypothetical protein